jgi:hypothetical protein
MAVLNCYLHHLSLPEFEVAARQLGSSILSQAISFVHQQHPIKRGMHMILICLKDINKGEMIQHTFCAFNS